MDINFKLFPALLLTAAGMAVAQDKPAEKPKDGMELPIKPTRKIEFTTEEVTWASLDVSPDGKTIVFELVGDLYTMPIEGGEAKLLVGGQSYDGMPRFSPDGKKIVFVSDRSGADNLWLCDADGANLKAVSQGRNSAWTSPSFTPDGNYVVGSKGMAYLPSYSLQMFDIRGGSGLGFGPAGILPGTLDDIRVGRTAPNRMGAVSSPDGRYFYFTERKGAWQYNQDNGGQTQVFRLDRVLQKVENITNEDGGAMRPMPTPDGRSILYFTRFRNKTGLKSMDLESGDAKWIAYPVDRDDMESRSTRDLMPSYAFLPGGKSIVLGLKGKIQKMDLATGKATVIPFKAHVNQMIGEEVHFRHRVEDSATIKAKIARTPALSPDRSTIAFCAFGRLYTMNLRDKTSRRVTDLDQNEFNPSWSPDGEYITFASWNPKRGGSIHVVKPNGGGLRTLTTRVAYYRAPIFTPDGKNIVFTSGTTEEGFDTAIRMAEPQADELDPSEIGRGSRYRPSYLQMIPASGGAVKQLMPTPGSYFFLKDPTRIYVNTGGGVKSMNLDGTDARDIARFNGAVSGAGPNPAFIYISPDGNQIVADVDHKLYTAILPLTGQVATLGALGGPVPVKKLSQGGGDNVAWTADGKGVFWSMGNKVYIQDLDQEKPTEIAVDVQMPRYTPRGKVLLRGARLITMKGDQVIPSGDILVVDNKIAQIGPRGSFPVPKDAKVIPMEGKTISPGYVDTHSHWFGNGDTAYPMSWAYLVNLAYGVTTNRDPQSGSDQIYDFADAIAAGLAPGPRMYTTGPGIFQGAGMEDKDAVFAYLKRYRDAYDTKTIKEYVAGDRLTIEHVAMACKEYGLTPTTEGALEIKRYIAEASAGISGHEHALPIELYDDMAQFIAKTRTFYTPTLIVSYGGAFGENYWFTNYDIVNEPKVNKFTPQRALDELIRRRNYWALPEEYNFKMLAEGCRKVVEAGGKIGVGCHGEFQGLGSHWEMWMLAEGGMSPLQVLRCATLFGAEAIGLDQDLGSLETGKMADLVVYDKNPLENIRHTNTIHWVMKDGELFDTTSMNSVWPVAKKLPDMYWEALKPPFLGK